MYRTHCFLLFLLLMMVSFEAWSGVASDNKEKTEENIRFQLAQNRLFLLQGKLREAEKSLLDAERLGAKGSKEYLVAKINTCMRVLCGKDGWAAVQDVERRFPKEKGLQELARRYRSASGSSIGSRLSLTQAGNAREDKIVRLYSEARVDNRIYLGAISDINRVSLEGVRNVRNGQTVNRKRTAVSSELYVEGALSHRILGRLQLFAGNDSVGIGHILTRQDGLGSSSLRLAWQQPEWSYNESIAFDGTRDSVLVQREQQLSNTLSASLGGGAAQYRFDGDKVADSLLLQGALNYRLSERKLVTRFLGKGSYIGLRYALDAEYAGDTRTRTATDGSLFRPLDLQDREFHSVTTTIGKSWSSGLVAEGYGGYINDRFGGAGPLFGGAVGYSLHNGLELASEFTQSISSSGSSEDTYTYGGLRLNWQY
jgi:hypothetical protein